MNAPRIHPTVAAAPAGALWFAENGAVLCTAHLGTTAAYTARTLDGHDLELVDAAARAEWEALVGAPPACETCAARARRTA